MKDIRKLKSKAKAAAGSALLVGATLTGAAGLAAAQDSGSNSMDLGDYPSPFVDEDGNVDSTIVVGEQARTADVVGAINVAGSLGNSAYTEETVQVSTSGAGGSWSAENGVTLDTTNDNLYYGDTIDSVRQTLTQNDLGILEETTFTNDDNDETDITNYLNVGSQPVTFGSGAEGIDDDEDPRLYVPVPSESDVGPSSDSVTINGQSVEQDNFLFNLQANFGESINFTAEEVRGEDINLFGTSYTVSEDNGDESDELILYGSSETTSVASGESDTVTIDGEEVTLAVTAVTGSDVAAIEVNGELEEYDEDESFTVEGQEVRVDNIIQTSADQSAGTVVFSIGSQELVLQDGEPIQDSDGDDIEGSYVEFDGGNTQNIYNGISSIDLYVGAEDDEEDYVEADETFTHSALPGVEFQFGGLNPNAAESEDATEVTVQTDGDQDATIEFTADSSDSVTQTFIHTENNDGSLDSNDVLADSDNDLIHNYERENIAEDEYFVTDAGDFSRMWEVTSIDRDSSGSDSITQSDEAQIELTDVATGDSVTVELDAASDDGTFDNDDEYYAGTEIIDGQSVHFALEGDQDNTDNAGFGDSGSVSVPGDDSETEFRVAWGDSSGVSTGSSAGQIDYVLDTGSDGATDFDGDGEIGDAIPGAKSIFTAVDTENGGAISFIPKPGISQDGIADDVVLQLPSTESTDSKRVQFDPAGDGSQIVDQTDDDPSDDVSHPDGYNSVGAVATGLTFDYDNDGDQDTTYEGGWQGSLDETDNHAMQDFTVGGVVYTAVENTDANQLVAIGLDPDQQLDDNSGPSSDVTEDLVMTPSAVAFQPENDDDVENAFVLQPTGLDSDNGYDFSGSNARTYTGSNINVQTLEGSDEDVDAGYNEYGTYVEQNTEDEGSVSLMLPAGQSTAGAAITGSDGSLSAEGGGSGSATTQTPTGWPDAAALDSDVDAEAASNLIMVGGPAVNSLTEDLAAENKTWTADQYEEGNWVLDLVEGFSEGQHALVVAGYGAEDTRAASEFISDYADNAEELAGQTRVNMETQ